jgi:hypothetical protein
MAIYTPKVNLIKAEQSDDFDFQSLINANWDKIDSRFAALITVANTAPSSPLAGDLWYQVV